LLLFFKTTCWLAEGERPKCPAPEQTFGAFKLVGRLRLPENLCGFRILVVLRGFYGNARNKACKSNEADRYQMIATPPLMHRKGHAGPRDQQRHQDDHGCCFICAPSRGHDDERAFHLLLKGFGGERALCCAQAIRWSLSAIPGSVVF
jgi:hypothetical protein